MRAATALDGPAFLPLSGSAQTRTVVAFRVHEQLPWLVPMAGQRPQLILDARIARIPNTQSWFRGMLNVRGNLVPVLDLAAWAGLDSTAQAVVTIDAGPLSLALLSLGPPKVLRAQPAPPAPVSVSPLADFLGACLASDEGLLREFDPFPWLRTSAVGIALAAPD